MPEPVHEIVIQTIAAYFLWGSSFFLATFVFLVEFAPMNIDSDSDSIMSERDIENATRIAKARANLVCGICLENVIEDSEVKEMAECGHQFHVPCINDWLVRRPICPYCRRNAIPELDE